MLLVAVELLSECFQWDKEPPCCCTLSGCLELATRWFMLGCHFCVLLLDCSAPDSGHLVCHSQRVQPPALRLERCASRTWLPALRGRPYAAWHSIWPSKG